MSQQPQASTSTFMDDGSMLTMLTAPPAEVIAAAETIQKIKGSLGTLGRTIDILGEQTVQMIQVGGQAGITHQIGSIRRHMKEQETRQEQQITEIQDLLRDVLEHDILDHLTQLVQAGVAEEVDALVAEQVNPLLPHYIPQELLDELREHKEQLEQVQKSLHNSESRRANATLRSHRMNEGVHTIFTAKGEIPHQFPRTLEEMFGMSGVTAASLVKQYGLGEPAHSRERNINNIMQHCGVQYQLVSTGAGAPIPCRTTAEVASDRRRDGGF
ncbi:hypothetical protein C8Q80DRAFT_517450 [Daedaleopsis nitida]|nr:hypothetical protein C8Q80DRAFT_517450 [Daedaleopsis nitida]